MSLFPPSLRLKEPQGKIEVLVKAEQDFYREKWQKGIERERVTSHHFERLTQHRSSVFCHIHVAQHSFFIPPTTTLGSTPYVHKGIELLSYLIQVPN